MKYKALIIGGDKRQEYMKNALEENMWQCFHIKKQRDASEIDRMSEYSHIILPLPLSRDGKHIYSDGELKLEAQEIIPRLMPYQSLVVGTLPKKWADDLESRGVDYYDFTHDEDFKKVNGYLTAQGALRLLLESTEEYIVGKKALITGFGCVGKALAQLLMKNSVDICVAARSKQQLREAGLMGFKTMSIGAVSSCIYLFDYIFGSVPEKIIDVAAVKSIKNEGIYFELASKPYGASADDFCLTGKRYIAASSLPGRFLPCASGRLMAESIIYNVSLRRI